MAENKRLLILGKSGGGSDSTGTNLYENQILLPLYFENISDTSKNVFLGLDYNKYGGRFPNISLQKSLNNTDWEDITIPTTDGGKEIISIPPKSRVYIKGVNEKFCNYQDGDYYNHYYFGTDKSNREYIFVGGNLMSIIKGDEFKTYNYEYEYNLSSYAFCKLFSDGYFSGVGDPNIIHFEKMIIGFPSGTDIIPSSNSFSYIFDTNTSALNLSHKTIYAGSNPKTNWCKGVNAIILNYRFSPNYSYDVLTTETKDYLNIGFTNGSTGITSYKRIINKPTIPTKTSELTNDSSFISENNIKTINGESLIGEGNLVINSFSGSYNDLTDKPTIPEPQVNSDWNSETGVSQILNKPNMTTQTLTFVDENNVETNVVVYIQPTV